MNMTASSIFIFYLLWRVYELSMENVRYGEIALAQKGTDVSEVHLPLKLPRFWEVSDHAEPS